MVPFTLSFFRSLYFSLSLTLRARANICVFLLSLFLSFAALRAVFFEFENLCVCFLCSRRICFCPLGFPRGLENAKARGEFAEEVSRIEEFLRDPLGIRFREKRGVGDSGWKDTVQVLVPKVVPPPPPLLPPPVVDGGGGGGIGGGGGGGNVVDEVAAAASAQSKRIALQKKAAAAMVAAEDYARRFESGDLAAVRFLVLSWFEF